LLAFERTDFAYGPTVRAVLEAHALDLIQRAIALDPAEPMAHTAFALILMVTGRHQESLEEADLAVSLAPNSATAHGQQGAVRLYAGRPHEGLEAVEMAMRLSPLDPLKLRWLSTAARAHYCIGNYQQAITVAQGVCRSYPRRAPPHLTLVAALGQTGQIERAQSVVQQARRTIGEHFLQPGSASHWPEQLPEHRAHLDEGLRKAGFIR
jgi:tetratricopeptide (TPR) repeat protein